MFIIYTCDHFIPAVPLGGLECYMLYYVTEQRPRSRYPDIKVVGWICPWHLEHVWGEAAQAARGAGWPGLVWPAARDGGPGGTSARLIISRSPSLHTVGLTALIKDTISPGIFGVVLSLFKSSDLEAVGGCVEENNTKIYWYWPSGNLFVDGGMKLCGPPCYRTTAIHVLLFPHHILLYQTQRTGRFLWYASRDVRSSFNAVIDDTPIFNIQRAVWSLAELLDRCKVNNAERSSCTRENHLLLGWILFRETTSTSAKTHVKPKLPTVWSCFWFWENRSHQSSDFLHDCRRAVRSQVTTTSAFKVTFIH